MVRHAGPDAWGYLGGYGVFAFFILSGYVVSYILHYSYLPLRHGLRKYYLNRALRVYPCYLSVCLLMLALIHFFPPQLISDISGYIGYPDGFGVLKRVAWLIINVSTVGTVLPFVGIFLRPVLVTVSWSLCIEITFWVLMPALLLYPRLRRYVVAFAILYTVSSIIIVASPSQLLFFWLVYGSQLGAALPFCAGLLLFLRKLQNRPHCPHALGIAAIALLLLVVIATPRLFSFSNLPAGITGFYPAIAINIVVIAYLSRFDQRALPGWLQKLDSMLGSLSYPIFLIHVPIALILHVYFPSIVLRSYPFFLCVFGASNIAAVLMHNAIEVPVNRLRRAIKC